MNDFELQSQSGQLWLDIQERLAAKDVTIATLTAERDAHAQTIADFLAADDAGKAKMIADAAKSADEKERDAARAKLDAAQAEVVAAQAELTAAVEKVEAKK
jgi:hypothetical protein